MTRPLVERGTSKQRAYLQATRNIVTQIVIVQQYEQYPGYQRFFSRGGGIFGVGRRPTYLRPLANYKDLTETRNRARKVSGTNSLQCRRFLRVRKCFCSRNRREEEMGRVKGSGEGVGREKYVFFFPLPLPPFLLSPSPLPLRLLFLLSRIFHCHKIKDGSYNNTNANKVRQPKIRLHC